jgi:16S rRNA (cytosine967-C5)-methyltransferase
MIERNRGGASGGRSHHLRQLWAKILALDGFPQLDRWISEEFRHHKNFGSRDRRWYSDALFGAVRHGALALFLEEQFRRSTTRRYDDAGALGLEVERFFARFPTGQSLVEGWRAEKSDRFFDWILLRGALADTESGLVLDPAVRRFYLDALRSFEQMADLSPRALWAGFPLYAREWLAQRVATSDWSRSEQTIFLESLSTRPPLWLRLNRHDRRDEVVASLRSEGFVVETEGDALRVLGTAGLTATTVFRDGLVEIQDFASQQAGQFVGAKPGQVVWDACAGGGGKTLQIAASLAGRGAVYASDVRAYKLEEVKKRARRAGFHNVRCLPWDGAVLPPFEREIAKRGGFDVVLVDAPCSATGTWRRNPDAKLRVSPESLAELAALQFEILKKTAAAVRPGGALVYATCSWIVAEDEEIVLRFLQAESSFKLERMELMGSPARDSDTLFAARLRRDSN